eukprot:1735777-Lingulodinium_polyedra.AAC.1
MASTRDSSEYTTGINVRFPTPAITSWPSTPVVAVGQINAPKSGSHKGNTRGNGATLSCLPG